MTSAGRPDGPQLTADVNGHLDYLSQLAQKLGMKDPVESYLVPVLGKWSDLHDEAGRWRAAAQVATSVTSRLTAPLAGLDAAWQGADADSFLEYMRTVGLAGNDLAAALGAMADALDKTADGIRQIATEMVGMLADTAEQSSDAMTMPVGGATRAAQHLDELDEPTGKLYESVRDVLDAFAKLCNGVQGGQLFGQISMAHQMPTQNWSPAAPAAAAAQVAATLASSVEPAFSGTLPVSGAQPLAATAPVGSGQPLSGVLPAAQAGSAVGAAASVPAAAAQSSAAATDGASAAATHAASAAATHAASAAAAASAGHASAAAAHAGGAAAAVASGGGAQQGPAPESGAVAAPADSPPAAVPGAAPPSDPATAGAAGGGGSGMPMGMGGMGGAKGGGGDAEHKSKIRITGDPREIFGKPDRTAPPVIGEE